MGEAKRRKAKDPNYGKNPNHQFDSDTKKFGEAKAMARKIRRIALGTNESSLNRLVSRAGISTFLMFVMTVTLENPMFDDIRLLISPSGVEDLLMVIVFNQKAESLNDDEFREHFSMYGEPMILDTKGLTSMLGGQRALFEFAYRFDLAQEKPPKQPPES